MAAGAAIQAAPWVSALALRGDTQQLTPIYRAMNPVELGRTMKYGYVPSENGFGEKQFTLYPSDANKYAALLPSQDMFSERKNPYTYDYRIVTSSVTPPVMSQAHVNFDNDTGMDLKGPVVSFNNASLPALNRDAAATGGIRILPINKGK